MALPDYSIDTNGTPQDVQRRQALADALIKQGLGYFAGGGIFILPARHSIGACIEA